MHGIISVGTKTSLKMGFVFANFTALAIRARFINLRVLSIHDLFRHFRKLYMYNILLDLFYMFRTLFKVTVQAMITMCPAVDEFLLALLSLLDGTAKV